MKTKLPLLLIICILLGAFINAAPLEVKSIDFELADEGEQTFTGSKTYDHKVKPGREFTMNVKVCNEFDKDANNSHIDEIDFRVVIEGIDDGSDYEADDVREFDLRADRCDDVEIEFDDGNRIPVEFEDGKFNVYVDGSGVLENGTTVSLESFNFTIEGEIQSKDAGLSRVRLDDPRLSCQHSNEVLFTVHNWGKDDLDEVEVLVYSKQLGIDARKTFALKEGSGSDSRKSDRIEFTIPQENWRDGDYKIEVTPRTGPTPSTNENDNTVDLIATLSGCDALKKELEKQQEAEKEEKASEQAEELEQITEELEEENNNLEEEKEKLEQEKKELEEQLIELRQKEEAAANTEPVNELSFNISELEALEESNSTNSNTFVPLLIAGLVFVLMILIVLVYFLFAN